MEGGTTRRRHGSDRRSIVTRDPRPSVESSSIQLKLAMDTSHGQQVPRAAHRSRHGCYPKGITPAIRPASPGPLKSPGRESREGEERERGGGKDRQRQADTWGRDTPHAWGLGAVELEEGLESHHLPPLGAASLEAGLPRGA